VAAKKRGGKPIVCLGIVPVNGYILGLMALHRVPRTNISIMYVCFSRRLHTWQNKSKTQRFRENIVRCLVSRGFNDFEDVEFWKLLLSISLPYLDPYNKTGPYFSAH